MFAIGPLCAREETFSGGSCGPVIMYTIDRNDDGRPDVIFFDLKQQKKWDISFWDEKFEGHWTLVGYQPDGKMTPSSFESYDKFQSRVATR